MDTADGTTPDMSDGVVDGSALSLPLGNADSVALDNI